MMKREGEPRIKDRLKDIIKVKETTRSPRHPAARTSTQLPILSTPKILQYTKDPQYTKDQRYKIQDSCAAATLLRLSYSSRLMCMHTQQLHPI